MADPECFHADPDQFFLVTVGSEKKFLQNLPKLACVIFSMRGEGVREKV